MTQAGRGHSTNVIREILRVFICSWSVVIVEVGRQPPSVRPGWRSHCCVPCSCFHKPAFSVAATKTRSKTAMGKDLNFGNRCFAKGNGRRLVRLWEANGRVRRPSSGQTTQRAQGCWRPCDCHLLSIGNQRKELTRNIPLPDLDALRDSFLVLELRVRSTQSICTSARDDVKESAITKKLDLYQSVIGRAPKYCSYCR